MTDQQPAPAEVGTVSLVAMKPEHVTATRACVDALQALPFAEAMVVLVNILCKACYLQNAPRDTTMRLVANIWDAMVALETDPKERA